MIFARKHNNRTLAANALGGTVADEVISSIRNATAFNTQEKLSNQYNVFVRAAAKSGFRMRTIVAIMIAILASIAQLTYVGEFVPGDVQRWLTISIQALAFWQGSQYLMAGDINLRELLTIVLAIILGAFALGNVSPYLQASTEFLSQCMADFWCIQGLRDSHSRRKQSI